MDTYNFPYYTFETQNPDVGIRVQLGGGYVFSAPPSAPDQRIFSLKYPQGAFVWYCTPGTETPDATINPTRNMKALSNFYQAHKLHKSFLWVHPIYGELVVKFSKPLKEPEGLSGGTGALKALDIELMEQPV